MEITIEEVRALAEFSEKGFPNEQKKRDFLATILNKMLEELQTNK